MALQGTSNVAQELESQVKMRSKKDQGCDSSATRQQGLSVKLRKNLLGDAEAVRPDQPAVFFYSPAIRYVAANHIFTVCGTTQHQPLKSEELRTRSKLYFCVAL